MYSWFLCNKGCHYLEHYILIISVNSAHYQLFSSCVNHICNHKSYNMRNIQKVNVNEIITDVVMILFSCRWFESQSKKGLQMIIVIRNGYSLSNRYSTSFECLQEDVSIYVSAIYVSCFRRYFTEPLHQTKCFRPDIHMNGHTILLSWVSLYYCKSALQINGQ